VTFDPDDAPGSPRRLLKGVRVPPVKPTAPWGRYSSRDLARAALLSALLREGDWWGLPLLTRWAAARALTPLQAQGLALELVAQGCVIEGHTSPGCPRWRARGGAS
jgi:hypothetical protein